MLPLELPWTNGDSGLHAIMINSELPPSPYADAKKSEISKASVCCGSDNFKLIIIVLQLPVACAYRLVKN